MTDTTPTAADHLLRLLLARMIAEGAHHAVASTRARTEEVARIHEGFAAQAELAAVYAVDLIVEGRMRQPGYETSLETEAAAQQVLDGLERGADAREQTISDAIYGGVPVRPEAAAAGGDSRT